MEADWEMEIGPGAPVIDAFWSGWVDLRNQPSLAGRLPETKLLGGLADALMQLNASGSPVWTAKCDVWPVHDRSEFDAMELDAWEEEAACAWACYVDLLPRIDRGWAGIESGWVMAGEWCKGLCHRLHAVSLRCCRVDLIVRGATIVSEREDHGVTAYLTACGSTSVEANLALQSALARFTDTLCATPTVE